MRAIIGNTPLHGQVEAISSKSWLHRALICAAMGEQPTRLRWRSCGEDVAATVRCLEALGAQLTPQTDGLSVCGGKTVSPAVLDCGESGSTLRFLLPLAGALGVQAAFYASGRLPQRPLSPLYEQLGSHGYALSEQGVVPLRGEGRLRGGVYRLPGNVSSQYVSGLLMALPLLVDDSEIMLTSKLESRPYVDLTLDLLRRFGVEIRETGDGFFVPGGQRPRTPGELTAEGDWSNAAFWLCAGALSAGGVTVCGLDPASRQGDRAVCDILSRFGAVLTVDGRRISVRRGNLRGIDVDCAQIPDLLPVLAAVAAGAEGTTRFYHAQRLRLKESDRLKTVAQTLSALGARVQEQPDGLTVEGCSCLEGGCVSGHNDHRIVMMAAVAAALCKRPVCIEQAQAVDKSYPDFFRDAALLSANVELQ